MTNASCAGRRIREWSSSPLGCVFGPGPGNLATWLDIKRYGEPKGGQEFKTERWDPKYWVWVVCPMASKTEGFQADKLSAATEGSLGIPFLRAAVTAPMQLYEHRAKEREKTMQLQMTTTQPLRQVMLSQRKTKRVGMADRKTRTQVEKDGIRHQTESDGGTKRRKGAQKTSTRWVKDGILWRSGGTREIQKTWTEGKEKGQATIEGRH